MIFKAVGEGRPYPDHGLHSFKDWSAIAPRPVRLDQLITTKRMLDLGHLLSEDSTFYGDLFPHVAKAYLIGEAAAEFSGTLGAHVPHEMSGTLEVAISSAARDAEVSGLSEAVVLLSPACASFDQYRNFEIRGNAFRDIVQALPGVKPVV